METLYLQNWKFSLEGQNGLDGRDLSLDPWVPSFDDSPWKEVVVPHDWAVGFPFSRDYSSGTGYLPGGTGWYRTGFTVPPGEGLRAFVNFEGVYKNSQVWCNGYYLGKRPNGYIGFRYDISHCLREGRNTLAVKVSHEDFADSRWYTGSGIYRRVFVEFHDPVFIGPESVTVKTGLPDGTADHGAELAVSGEAVNTGAAAARGLVVRALVEGQAGESFTAEFSPPDIEGGAALPFQLNITIPHPRLWSADTPELYRLTLELAGPGGEPFFRGRPLRIGIRSIRFDPDRGFFINGKNEKLRGVCFHHDSGCLGAAFWPEVWRRRLLKLKEAGCNALRCSHNPQSPELYDLCDELGFYVMDEAFDEWEGCKNKWRRGHNVYPPVHQGYYEDFPQWHERDLADMVIRDRNHPSVILWSIGNEIDYPNDPYVHPLFADMAGNNDANKPREEQRYNPDKPGMERLAVVAAELAGIVKRYDTSRPVLCAAAFPELSSRLGFFDALDMAGYNYKEQLYEADHRRFPKLPLIGSENSHHLAAWKAVRDNDYIGGQFLWTGIDFLGEARGWPIRGSGAGILDLGGNEKPGYYRRKILWTGEPALCLAACIPREGPSEPVQPWEVRRAWNFYPGDEVRVICYTGLDGAELFINGRSLGAKTRDPALEYILWTTAFERGTLEVRGLHAGVAVSDRLESALPAARLRLRRWEAPAPAPAPQGNQWELVQIEIEALDGEGRLCGGEGPLVEAAVNGAGILLGLENGDIADCTAYAEPRRRCFQGRLMAYLLTPRDRKEKVLFEASAEGLQKARLEV